MKASQIMRRAAEISEQDSVGGCLAIDEAYTRNKHREAKERAQERFEELFKNRRKNGFWFGHPRKYSKGVSSFFLAPWTTNTQNQKHRITAMLLTADILESEGD
jgi:hypothetical protein